MWTLMYMGMIAGDRSLSVWDSEEEDEVKKTDGVGQTACGGCLDERQTSRLQGFTPALGLSDAPPKEKTKAKIVAWKVLKSCDSLCGGGREAALVRWWCWVTICPCQPPCCPLGLGLCLCLCPFPCLSPPSPPSWTPWWLCSSSAV